MNHGNKKKVLLFLVLLLAAMIIGFGIFFITTRIMDPSPTLTDLHIDSEAALTLNLIKQISKKNGITEWELEAATATLMKKQDQAVLTDVNVVFHTADNSEVFLTSDRGILDTRSHDMSFVGNVVVRHETYILKTDKLHYKKKPHIIYSDAPVRLADEISVIQADTMEISLHENTVTLQGHVKGRFSEKTALP